LVWRRLSTNAPAAVAKIGGRSYIRAMLDEIYNRQILTFAGSIPRAEWTRRT